ncbi:tetratricopeptide repeat protein [Microbacterium sp. NPDC090225]|uniref:tetratricopeptide repeat protein n=1 Tax=Microbacterium sp. NPDC090225 TaxID=3364207 RepID=UPI0038197C11
MPEPRTFDDLCARLNDLRAADGGTSFSEIARRIGVLRGGAEPAKVTVYDCFRPGRRRVDEQLVGDIVRVLRGDDAEAARWAEAARSLNGIRSGVRIDVGVGVRAVESAEVGREGLLLALPAVDVLLLTGLPGVGKSTLATAVLGGAPALTVDLRASDPGRPSADPVDVLRRMLGAWGNRSVPYDIARLRERVRAEASGMVVVLEDAGSGEQLIPLVVPGVRYIVTSRVDLEVFAARLRSEGISAAHQPVRPLDDAGSRRLLARLLSDATGSPDEAGRGIDDRALDRIVAVGGGLPLDLAMLAGVVAEHAGWTFDDLASRFETEPRDARMRPVLEAATRSLSAPDADLLADLALIDREFEEGVLLATGDQRVVRGLERLRSRHLLERVDGRIQVHATVFAFASERSRALRPASRRRAFVARVTQTVLDRMAVDDDYAAREVGTVLAVADAAREHGLDAELVRLVTTAHPALVRWSLWGESLRLHEVAAPGAGADPAPELALGIAQCAEKLGRYDEALITLHRVRRTAVGTALARTWNQIGNVQRWMSHHDEALESYATAIAHARDAGDRIVEGRAQGNHADTLRILARYAEADAGYERALAMAIAERDVLNTTIVRGNRALHLLAIGRLDDAERSLDVLDEASAEPTPPFALRTRALIAEARGDDISARAWLTRAVRPDGEYGTEADAALLAARIDARDGRSVEARDAAESVLHAAVAAGSPLIATEAGNSLAEILLRIASESGDTASVLLAERRARDARGIAEATGDRAEVARSDGILSAAAAARGDADAAVILSAASRDLYRELGHRCAGAGVRAAVPAVERPPAVADQFSRG